MSDPVSVESEINTHKSTPVVLVGEAITHVPRNGFPDLSPESMVHIRSRAQEVGKRVRTYNHFKRYIDNRTGHHGKIDSELRELIQEVRSEIGGVDEGKEKTIAERVGELQVRGRDINGKIDKIERDTSSSNPEENVATLDMLREVGYGQIILFADKHEVAQELAGDSGAVIEEMAGFFEDRETAKVIDKLGKRERYLLEEVRDAVRKYGESGGYRALENVTDYLEICEKEYKEKGILFHAATPKRRTFFAKLADYRSQLEEKELLWEKVNEMRGPVFGNVVNRTLRETEVFVSTSIVQDLDYYQLRNLRNAINLGMSYSEKLNFINIYKNHQEKKIAPLILDDVNTDITAKEIINYLGISNHDHGSSTYDVISNTYAKQTYEPSVERFRDIARLYRDAIGTGFYSRLDTVESELNTIRFTNNNVDWHKVSPTLLEAVADSPLGSSMRSELLEARKASLEANFHTFRSVLQTKDFTGLRSVNFSYVVDALKTVDEIDISLLPHIYEAIGISFGDDWGSKQGLIELAMVWTVRANQGKLSGKYLLSDEQVSALPIEFQDSYRDFVSGKYDFLQECLLTYSDPLSLKNLSANRYLNTRVDTFVNLFRRTMENNGDILQRLELPDIRDRELEYMKLSSLILDDPYVFLTLLKKELGSDVSDSIIIQELATIIGEKRNEFAQRVSYDKKLYLPDISRDFLNSPHTPEEMREPIRFIVDAGFSNIASNLALEYLSAKAIGEHDVVFRTMQSVTTYIGTISAQENNFQRRSHDVLLRVMSENSSYFEGFNKMSQLLQTYPDQIPTYLKVIDFMSSKSGEDWERVSKFFLLNVDKIIQDDSDFKFLDDLVVQHAAEFEPFLKLYVEGLETGRISKATRGEFLRLTGVFPNTLTAFSFDRLDGFNEATNSVVGRALIDLLGNGNEYQQVMLDVACYQEHYEVNKQNYLIELVKAGASKSDLLSAARYLRWLPNSEVSVDISIQQLGLQYETSLENLKTGLNTFMESIQGASLDTNVENLVVFANSVGEALDLDTREVLIEGLTHKLNLPADFVREYQIKKRSGTNASVPVELSAYLIDTLSKKSTAYTVEDVVYSQIGNTEDRTGRRRGRYSAEVLLTEMENNVEASLRVWNTVIEYQNRKSDSPVFLVANERTGPADVAAEYLSSEFATTHGVVQNVNYEAFYEWFLANQQSVNDLYERHRTGENVSDLVSDTVKEYLGLSQGNIVPIYRIKVPSSLDASTAEPAGVDKVIDLLKLFAVLGGRTLFMDESTRSAPRSIECLYNVLNRRQDQLGGVDILLAGKIDGATGQNNTELKQVKNPKSSIEIMFIDPWHAESKPVNDDSEKFVPEVTGDGVVEIMRPSFTAIHPYGVSTLQDYWKRVIANEVTNRFAGFRESAGQKSRREDVFGEKKIEAREISQAELIERAYSKPYKAIVVDLDGTVGNGGKYDQEIVERLKEISSQGIDVVVGTARSLVDHPEYSGSVKSFIAQLGELTDQQKERIHFGTEGGAVITTLSDLEKPHVLYGLSGDVSEKAIDVLKTLSPQSRIYIEQGTLVVRDFDSKHKDDIIGDAQKEIDRLGLPLFVTSDSKRAIHIRSRQATKRNMLDWLESRGLNVNDIAKIGNSAEGNDRAMFWGRGSFNVGDEKNGTVWTINLGGGIDETLRVLRRLIFG